MRSDILEGDIVDGKITIKEVEFCEVLGVLQSVRRKTFEVKKRKCVVNQVDQW